MPDIPSTINEVTVEFKSTVNKSVDQRVVDALKEVIKKDIANGHTLTKIYISSANDSHSSPSRHVQGSGKAVDISRINGKKMSVYYSTDDTVKAITNAIQDKFESYAHRRENFGPHFKKKLGVVKAVSGHKDHIHLSVN
jgi:hypothetical protein